MKRPTYNQVFDVICICLIIGLVLFAYSNGIDLAVSLEQWDTVATAGWALLPIAVIFLLVALAKLALAVRTLIEVEQGTQAAKTELIKKQADEADARSWQIRHESKAFRRNNGLTNN